MTSERQRDLSDFSYRGGKHRLKSIRWMLFFIVAVQTAVTIVSNIIIGFMPAEPPVYLQMLVIELLAYLLPLFLYAKENRLLTAGYARERFGLKPCKKSLIPFVIIAGYGCQFVMVLLDLPVNLLMSQGDGYIPQNLYELAAAIIVIAVIPALFEEFLLRGIVYGVMAEFNSKAALIFTTVMFALLHGNPAGMLGYLFLGVVLVFFLRRTGSLYACMLLHMTNNVTAVLLSYYNAILMETPSATIWLFVTGILAELAACAGITAFTRPAKLINITKTRELLGQSFVNIPILLCIIIIIAFLYLQMF